MRFVGRFRNTRLLWMLLGLCAVSAFIVLSYPIYVIRPFRAQGPRELSFALLVRSWAPVVGWIVSALAVGVVAALWPRTQRRRVRALSVITGALAVAFGALTHVNVYEKMF